MDSKPLFPFARTVWAESAETLREIGALDVWLIKWPSLALSILSFYVSTGFSFNFGEHEHMEMPSTDPPPPNSFRNIIGLLSWSCYLGRGFFPHDLPRTEIILLFIKQKNPDKTSIFASNSLRNEAKHFPHQLVVAWFCRLFKARRDLQFSSVQSLSHVWLFATPWIAARQASLSITNSQSSLRLTSIKLVMPSSHLILS